VRQQKEQQASNIDELSLHRPLVTTVASMKRPKRKNTMGVCTTIDRGSQNFLKSKKNKKNLTDFFLGKDEDVLVRESIDKNPSF
jgi:hypothetical protein